MANVAFPTAPLSRCDISLTWPGQVIHTGIYTNERQVLERGVGVWQGSIMWDVRSRSNQDAEIVGIETFLHQLGGAANTFDVPIPRDQSSRFAEGTIVRVNAMLRTGSTMRLTLDANTGLQLGDFINISNMLFQCVSGHVGGVVQVSPYRPLDIPTAGLGIDWSNPTLRARRTSADSVANPRDLDWAGPWTLDITGD